MTHKDFETYIWGGMERVRCPAPCRFDYETAAEVQACYDVCPRHPKPTKRVSEIVGPKGEDVVVVEEPAGFPAMPETFVSVDDEVIPLADIKTKRFKRQDADATGEP